MSRKLLYALANLKYPHHIEVGLEMGLLEDKEVEELPNSLIPLVYKRAKDTNRLEELAKIVEHHAKQPFNKAP